MEKEFEVKIYTNRNTKQFILIPMKKKLSNEILEIMNDKKVKGLKVKIIKQLKREVK